MLAVTGKVETMTNILQSEIWAQFQKANGHQVFTGQGPGYRFMATLEGGKTGRYLYCPYGPVADDAASFDAALAALAEIARQNKCWFLRVEPTNPEIFGGQDPASFLQARGMKLSPRQVQPSHTQIIDLGASEEEILKDMKSTNRNLHRNIHKKGVTFETSQNPADLDILLKFLDETAGRTGFNRQRDDYLRKVAQVLMPADAATLYLARVEGEPIGAALVYDSDDTRTYAHAATSFEHRKLSAGIPLVTNLIVDAKAKGLKYVDLFGIAPDDDPEHEWAGFTKFKKSFGGSSVVFPGTWDKPVSAGGYRAYEGIRAARELASKTQKKASADLLPLAKQRGQQAASFIKSKLGK